MRKTLIVIPARGGSKGIPKKNLRLLSGRPLISYVIELALSIAGSDVVVSSDDDMILSVASKWGADTIARPDFLSDDDTPLDPVIWHALRAMEQTRETTYDVVVTLQPTSPLLSSPTLHTALQQFGQRYDTIDSMIAVVNETHLYWAKVGDEVRPRYDQRVNRQYLDPIYKETGAFLISKRNVVSESDRLGDTISLFEVPKEQSVDIDSVEDWWVAEQLLRQPRVAIRTDADELIGMGHVYRCLTLAQRLFVPRLTFFMHREKALGVQKVRSHHFEVKEIVDDDDFVEYIAEYDLLLNDVLDTSDSYMRSVRDANPDMLIVSFEDLGMGAHYADLVFNALYESSMEQRPGFHFGFNYVCLRDEFAWARPISLREDVHRVLITFGGADYNNLTTRVLGVLEQMRCTEFEYVVVLGMGFRHFAEVEYQVERMRMSGFDVQLKENVVSMAEVIETVDMAITSNGRTVYELASLCVPTITLSQNIREARHMFGALSGGVHDLGLFSDVTDDNISYAIKRVMYIPQVRARMHQALSAFDLQQGTDRVLELIMGALMEKRSKTSGPSNLKEAVVT